MKIIMIDQYSDELITFEILVLLNSQMKFIKSCQSIEEVKYSLKQYFTSDSNAKLLLIYDNQLVGFAFFNISIGLETKGKYIWLNEIHISSEFQKQDYGSNIVKYLEKYALDNDILKIMGLVSNSNSASNFYVNKGFTLEEYSLFSKSIKKEKL